MDSPDTEAKIFRTVETLRNHLIPSHPKDSGEEVEIFSVTGLYRMAQKERIESTMIWLMDKLKTVSVNIPKGLDAEEAQRKLIKS